MNAPVIHIHFGIHTDPFAQQTKSAFGAITLGRVGLLSVMETQLGLPLADLGRTRNVVAYRTCLENAQTRPRFYDTSCRTDPVGLTCALPQCREQWYQNG